MKRSEIINKLIKKFNFHSYLEIGIFDGINYSKIACDYKVGVDPSPRRSVENLHKISSDEFFENNTDKFDIVFIDGLHHYEQVRKDLESSLKLLNKNGVLVVHDCNPENELRQRVPREVKVWNGDVWKAWVEFINNYSNKYNLFTVDTDHGVGILLPGSTEYSLVLPKKLEYSWLEKNRKEALNLISSNEFKKMLNF